MKLLATDFDSTLLNRNDYVKNTKYVNKFVEDGNIFVIVTGRYIDSLLKDIAGRDIRYNYLICNDGGVIFDKNLNVIYQRDIPQNIVSGISTLYEKSNCIDDWYIDTGLTITKDKNSNANGLIGRFNNREEASKLLNFIKEQYEDVNGYLSERWINITEKSVNKGSAIKILSNKEKVDDKNVYTIGDNTNDISMSNYNFNNFCMTNSVLELKRKTKRAYNSVYELIMDIIKDGLE